MWSLNKHFSSWCDRSTLTQHYILQLLWASAEFGQSANFHSHIPAAAIVDKWRYCWGWWHLGLQVKPGMSSWHITHRGHQSLFTIVMVHRCGLLARNDPNRCNVSRMQPSALSTDIPLFAVSSSARIIVAIDSSLANLFVRSLVYLVIVVKD